MKLKSARDTFPPHIARDLFLDAMGGDLHPQSDPERRTHTAARLIRTAETEWDGRTSRTASSIPELILEDSLRWAPVDAEIRLALFDLGRTPYRLQLSARERLAGNLTLSYSHPSLYGTSNRNEEGMLYAHRGMAIEKIKLNDTRDGVAAREFATEKLQGYFDQLPAA